MQTRTCLNQTELAARWSISARTLERWRWTGEGPAFLKIGGRVVYRLEDVLAYEQARQRRSTADRAAASMASVLVRSSWACWNRRATIGFRSTRSWPAATSVA